MTLKIIMFWWVISAASSLQAFVVWNQLNREATLKGFSEGEISVPKNVQYTCDATNFLEELIITINDKVVFKRARDQLGIDEYFNDTRILVISETATEGIRAEIHIFGNSQ